MREHESEMRSSLESMLEPVGRYRSVRDDNGEVVDLLCVYLNRAGREMLGEEAIDNVLSERLRAADREHVLAFWIEAANSPEPVRYEYEVDEDGRQGHYQVQVLQVHDGVITSWRDVSAERRLQVELQQSATLWHSVADAATDASLTLGSDGTVLYVSATLCDFLGFAEKDVIGQHVLTAVHRHDHDAVEHALHAAAASDGRQVVEFRFWDPRDHARTLWLEARLNGIDTLGGREINVGLRDVTKARDERMRLGHQATHDSLTGLLNRNGFEHALDERLRAGAPTFVMYLDLDRFKPVNDQYGHAAGDEVLIEVARRLRSELRDSDIIARLGGDEFCLCGRPLPGDSELDALTRRLSNAVSRPIRLGNGWQVTVGASFGYTLANEASTVHELLDNADREMYSAKRTDLPFPSFFDGGDRDS